MIVGGGPVGLYAAYYAGFRGLDTVLLEALPMLGGQISTFYPESTIYDVPGFPAVTGSELVDRLTAQMRAFPIDVRLAEEVEDLARDDDGLVLRTRRTSDGGGVRNAYQARAVLLAAGIGSFAPQRIKDPAIARFEGRGLHYHAPPAERVSGREALVLGGSERAVQLALGLAAQGARVTLAHRRDRLAASEAMRHELAASPVRFLPFHDLDALLGTERVERARLTDRRDGSRREERADLVLPCYAFQADASALRRFGVRLEGDAVLVDSRMASDAPGIYAAGDGATYPGKVRVLAADFGEACTAVNNVAATIVPGAHLFPGYSSHRKGAARR
ncbi:MAG: NAD(P)/FAD-dependent oxidoreductase [Thermodesulfobacteriota bacterium]